MSIALLGESLSATGVLGIALVVVGIFAAHLPRRAVPGSRRAAGLALLTGLTIAGYSLVNKLGVQRMPVPLYATLAKMEPVLEEAAGDLGAPPWQVFWLVTFPLSLPGVGAGAKYKFEIRTQEGRLRIKADPLAFHTSGRKTLVRRARWPAATLSTRLALSWFRCP